MTCNSMSLIFRSSLDNTKEVNSSFDRGVLRIAYHGPNRNGTFISKEAFEAGIPSLFNCPIVCNYDRDADAIGEHDIELVRDERGMRIVNLTEPVGVIPESARVWWETFEEDDGKTHEYLCAEALIWKRQEAYAKIRKNGVTDESMEIRIKRGHADDEDGLFHIDDLEFLAFCLLESAEPCMESAALQMFATADAQMKYARMLDDLKQCFADAARGAEKRAQASFAEGGAALDLKELMAKYGLTEEDIDFDMSGLSEEELEARFVERRRTKVDTADDGDEDGQKKPEEEGGSEDGGGEGDGGDEEETPEPETEPGGDGGGEENGEDTGEEGAGGEDDEENAETFKLNNVIVSAIYEALEAETYHHPDWGDVPRYWFIDYDAEKSMVYCVDEVDRCLLVGFSYAQKGDRVEIDFASRKRMRYEIVEYDDGGAEDTGIGVFAHMCERKFVNVSGELNMLRAFYSNRMNEERREKEDVLFAQFAKLDGVEAFETLKADHDKYSLEEIEEKCYAILGRQEAGRSTMKFSATGESQTRLPVDAGVTSGLEDEPYGGLFVKYGRGK